MKLAHQQLTTHLTKEFAPLYVVSGDETLLVQEALDQIRSAAKSKQFSERIRISAENSDWLNQLSTEAQSFSLFSTKRLIEIDLTHAKFSAAQTTLLKEILAALSVDTLLLFQLFKIDSKTEKTAWFQALEKKGVHIPIWPVTIEQLPQWILSRAKKFNLNMTKTAADRLAFLVEGNLLAASQEIEKLSLLDSHTTLDEDTIENAVSNHSHFDIFQLVDSVLLGKKSRSLQILQNLFAEGTESILILWALARELRTLAELSAQTKQGTPLPSLFSQYRIWEKRQPIVKAFLQRHTLQNCWQFLKKAAQIDRMIKGAEMGNAEIAIQQWVVEM